jgi:bifunctional non-homologous end joining protein LigD
MASADPTEQLEIDGRVVSISNPRKVLFPGPGHTKLDLVRYYLAVAPGGSV